MWARLKRITILLAVIPWTATGILLLAGAGIFSWLAGYLLFAIGEGILAREKRQANAQAVANWQLQQLQIQPLQGGLSLVEMDVQMRYRDKSVDLRVIN